MGRSVSVPSNTFAVCYRDVSDIEDSWEWDAFCEWVRDASMRAFPSFYEVDDWAGREDRVLLRNGHAEIGVSEYCGLASIWLRVRTDVDHEVLAERWAAQAEPKFSELFGELRLVGRFSNGEALYERWGA